jgi:hypothetical protein
MTLPKAPTKKRKVMWLGNPKVFKRNFIVSQKICKKKKCTYIFNPKFKRVLRKRKKEKEKEAI